MKKIFLTLSFSLLCACSLQETKPQVLPTFAHYKACDLMSLDIVSTLQCGKTSRNSYCLPDNKCSEKGNSLVAYYDKLAKSISMNQLSEIEARKLFLKRNNEAELEYNVVMHELEKQRKESVSIRINSVTPEPVYLKNNTGRSVMDPRSPLSW